MEGRFSIPESDTSAAAGYGYPFPIPGSPGSICANRSLPDEEDDFYLENIEDGEEVQQQDKQHRRTVAARVPPPRPSLHQVPVDYDPMEEWLGQGIAHEPWNSLPSCLRTSQSGLQNYTAMGSQTDIYMKLHEKTWNQSSSHNLATYATQPTLPLDHIRGTYNPLYQWLGQSVKKGPWTPSCPRFPNNVSGMDDDTTGSQHNMDVNQGDGSRNKRKRYP
ncbi:hypothetical protein TWF730_003177 [Orbilia blumenaviensis]|uniref:Uncharacterized protein n=1 Tax=Orbilia blumenaviensis TaxID=1796055 RepID=A0AAV9U8Z2_9PEZI